MRELKWCVMRVAGKRCATYPCGIKMVRLGEFKTVRDASCGVLRLD